MGANGLFGSFEPDCGAMNRTSLSNVQAKLFGLFVRPNSVVSAHSHLPETRRDFRLFRMRKITRYRNAAFAVIAGNNHCAKVP
jgi:hypothetical protein